MIIGVNTKVFDAKFTLKQTPIKKRTMTELFWPLSKWRWTSVWKISQWVLRTTTTTESFVSSQGLIRLAESFNSLSNLRHTKKLQWTCSSTLTPKSFWRKWNPHWRRNLPFSCTTSWRIFFPKFHLMNGSNKSRNKFGFELLCSLSEPHFFIYFFHNLFSE